MAGYRSPYSWSQPEPQSSAPATATSRRTPALPALKPTSQVRPETQGVVTLEEAPTATNPGLARRSGTSSVGFLAPLEFIQDSVAKCSERLGSISFMYSPQSLNPHGLEVRATTLSRKLLLMPPKPLRTSSRGDRLVDACMESNSVEIVTRLLDGDTTIYRPVVDAIHSVHGLTPLMAACKFVRPSTVRALIKRGADPNMTRRITGDTALHVAAKAGSALSVKILLDAGAVQVCDRRGCTPLDYANERPENHSLISMLWSAPNRPGKVCVVMDAKSQQMNALLEEGDGKNGEGEGDAQKEDMYVDDSDDAEEYELEEYTIDVSASDGTGTDPPLGDHGSDADDDVAAAAAATPADKKDEDFVDPRVCLKLRWAASANNGTAIRNNEIAWAALSADEVDQEERRRHRSCSSSSSSSSSNSRVELEVGHGNEAPTYRCGILPGNKALAVLKGLLPCTFYKIKVRSRNIIGWGSYGEPSVIWSGSSVPQGMQTPIVVRQTSSVLVLEWQPPISSNGEIVDRYEIEVKFRSLGKDDADAVHQNDAPTGEHQDKETMRDVLAASVLFAVTEGQKDSTWAPSKVHGEDPNLRAIPVPCSSQFDTVAELANKIPMVGSTLAAAIMKPVKSVAAKFADCARTICAHEATLAALTKVVTGITTKMAIALAGTTRTAHASYSEYLVETAQIPLHAALAPVVADVLQAHPLTKAWAACIQAYNSVMSKIPKKTTNGLKLEIQLDLAEYVLNRTLSTLKMLVAEKESSIRGGVLEGMSESVIKVLDRSSGTTATVKTHISGNWQMFRRVTPFTRYEIPVEGTDVHTSNLWYVFRVRAHNAHGWSSFSPPSAGCETLDFSEATSLGAREARVNWPRVLGASKYQIQAAWAGSLEDLFAPPTLPWKTMCEVLPTLKKEIRPNTIVYGCEPANYYVFRVLDYHEMFGWSFGAQSDPIQMEAAAPAAPPPAILQNVTPQALIVMTVLSKNNGCQVDAMEIAVKLLETEEDEEESGARQQNQRQLDHSWYSLDLIKVGPRQGPGQGQRSLKTKIPDLKIFRSYIVRYRLRNGIGWSDWSPDSDRMRTSASPPDPPQRPAVRCISDRSVEVSWIVPKSFGSDIIGFRAQICHVGPEFLPHQINGASSTKRLAKADQPNIDAGTLVNDLFLTIDEDNDGFISKHELLQAFSKGGTNQKARRLLTEILSRERDRISDSLVDDVNIQSLALLLRLNEEYHDAFTEIDTDRSGYVTRDELMLFCAEKEGWSDIQLPHHPHPFPDTSFVQADLCPGEAYRFRIVAVNEVGPGCSSSSTKVVMPCIAAAAPPRPTIVATTQTTVSLGLFATPDSGGDPSLSVYEIARRLGHVGENDCGTNARKRRTSINRLLEWTVVGSVNVAPKDSMPFEFTDQLLVPGSCYDYAVRAVSIVGPSPWSEASGPITTDGKEPSVPSAAVLREGGRHGTTLGGRHGTTLNIEWLPPAAAISKKNVELEYEIEQKYLELEDVEVNQQALRQWHQSRYICNDDGDAGEHPWARISNILPGACVRFRVRAKNSFGVGSWGAESMGIDTAVTVPDPVAPPTIDNQGEREISVKWTRPPCRGASVTMYELARLTVGKNWETIGEWEVELRTATMHYVVPNLKPATSLCFRVRAYNKLGWGEFGYACENTRTLSTIPAKPSPPIMLSWNPDDLTILVSWSHMPSAADNGPDNGAAITRYEVQRRDFTEGARWEDVGTTSGADRFIETTEPKPVCLKRWFRVRAVNEHGNSSWSEKSVDFVCRPAK